MSSSSDFNTKIRKEKGFGTLWYRGASQTVGIQLLKEEGAPQEVIDAYRGPKDTCETDMKAKGHEVLFQRDCLSKNPKKKSEVVVKIFGSYTNYKEGLKEYKKQIHNKTSLHWYENVVSSKPGRLFFDIDWTLSHASSDASSSISKEALHQKAGEIAAALQSHLNTFWVSVFPTVEPPTLTCAKSISKEKIGLHLHAGLSYPHHFQNVGVEMKAFHVAFVKYIRDNDEGIFKQVEDRIDKIMDTNPYKTGAFRMLYSSKMLPVGHGHKLKPLRSCDSDKVEDYLVNLLSDDSQALPAICFASDSKGKRKADEPETEDRPLKKSKSRPAMQQLLSVSSSGGSSDSVVINDAEAIEDPLRAAQIAALDSIVSSLSAARATERETWINVCFALRNVGEEYKLPLYELFLRFSSRTTRNNFRREDCHEKFFEKGSDTNPRKLRVGSLILWASEDSGKASIMFPTKLGHISSDADAKECPMFIDASEPMPKEMMDIPEGSSDLRAICEMESGLKLPPLTYTFQYSCMIRCDYGIGKTSRLVREVILGAQGKQNDFCITKEDKVIFVTFRVALAEKLVKDLSDIGLKSYQSVDDDELNNTKYLAIQLESLRRLNVSSLGNFVLVLDECESLLKHMESSTMKDYWKSLIRLGSCIKSARTVVALDRDLNARTYNLLSKLRPTARKAVCINTFKKHKGETVCAVKSLQDLVRYLVCDIRHNRKFALCSASKSTLDVIYAYLSKKFPEKNLKYYSSETSLAIKKRDTSDVNISWADADGIMYTPAFLAALSYTVPDVNRMYVIGSRHSCTPRELAQMMRRVRIVSVTALDDLDMLASNCEYIYFFNDNWNPSINQLHTLDGMRSLMRFSKNAGKVNSILYTSLNDLLKEDDALEPVLCAAFKEVHAFNLLEALDSFWNYNHRFRAQMTSSGVALIDLQGVEPPPHEMDGNVDLLLKDLTNLAAEIKCKALEHVATVDLPTEQEYQILKRNPDKSTYDRARIARYELHRFYFLDKWIESTPLLRDHSGPVPLDPAFVSQYTRKEVQATYENWRPIVGIHAPTMESYILPFHISDDYRVAKDDNPLNQPDPFAQFRFEVLKLDATETKAKNKLGVEIIGKMGWDSMETDQRLRRDDVKRNLRDNLPEIREKLGFFKHLPGNQKKCISEIFAFCRERFDVPNVSPTGKNYLDLKPRLVELPPRNWTPDSMIQHRADEELWNKTGKLHLVPFVVPLQH